MSLARLFRPWFSKSGDWGSSSSGACHREVPEILQVETEDKTACESSTEARPKSARQAVQLGVMRMLTYIPRVKWTDLNTEWSWFTHPFQISVDNGWFETM